MTFSYTQISQYLRCPRSYRFRYLDGWKETESRASLCFGRCFEKALAAFFEREDPEQCCSRSGERTAMLRSSTPTETTGSACFAKGSGCSSSLPEITESAFANRKRNLQKKLVRSLPNGHEFVAYVDAIGHLGRQAAFARMENHQCSLSGAARRADLA